MKLKSALSQINLKLVILAALVITALTGVVLLSLRLLPNHRSRSLLGQTPSKLAATYERLLPPDITVTPSPSASPSPSPTPKPLTFSELNALYGPCTVLPTLMYHHIQDLGIAQTEGHKSLTVDTKIFRSQMQYLKDRGYNVLPVSSLIAFFDSGSSIPKKSVLLTFDDGYDDFATDAAPILKEFNFPGTMFVPTGLIQNPGYMSWSTIVGLATSQNILMANHTWSHHNMGAGKAIIEKEVTLADTQLSQRGLDTPKVFAYPYGLTSTYAINFLSTQGYKLAFTTVHGSTLCRQQRLTLPRIRVGNASLSAYGL